MTTQNCELLSRDTVVARQIDGRFDVLRPDLLPLFLRRVESIDLWLSKRATDDTRAHTKLLKQAIGIPNANDPETALAVNGATITDTYWVREIGSNTKYDDVRFSKNDYADLALLGVDRTHEIDSPTRRTPELTNVGSFEKCWRLENGNWYLVKQATEREAFSEIFISRMCRLLGIPAAVYEQDTYGVRTPDFTNSATVNLEPASSFIRENDNGDYEKMYQAIVSLCPSAGLSFVQMIFVDAVFRNVDRHLENFGLLRDPGTGEIIGMAPLYDHNMALVARDDPTVGRDDRLLRDYRDFIVSHPEYRSILPMVTPETFERAMEGLACPVDPQYIVELVTRRCELSIKKY